MNFPIIAPRWAVMWGLSFLIYALLKGITWWKRAPGKAAWGIQIGYLLAWPGMDPDAFLGLRPTGFRRPNLAEWFFAAGKFALGLILIRLSFLVLENSDPYWGGWIGMSGIVFTLHFGLFHLLSCGWRAAGVPAIPLMNWPILSESLSEFWGQRWNLAFRDVTYRFLFQPLAKPLGPVRSLLVGFLVSGLVHDAIISWPAGDGFGMPTGYFAIQGVGILIERSRVGRVLGLGKGWIGRWFSLMVLLGPSPLLFHWPFVSQVIIPFLKTLESILLAV